MRRFLSIQKPETYRDGGRKEKLRGESNDAIDDIGAYQRFSDCSFRLGRARQRPQSQDESRPTGWAQVMDEMLDPGVVSIAVRRTPVLPPNVAGHLCGAPRLLIERRICENEVRFQR